MIAVTTIQDVDVNDIVDGNRNNTHNLVNRARSRLFRNLTSKTRAQHEFKTETTAK